MPALLSTSNTHWLMALDVKAENVSDFRALMAEMVTATEQEDGAIAYEWSSTEDGTQWHIYERYADPAAAMVHLKNFGAFAERFFALATTKSMCVYGDIDDMVAKALGRAGGTMFAAEGGFARG